MRAKCSNLVMKTTNHIIEQASKIKVLGMYISSSLSNIPTINNIISKVNYRLYTLKKILKYTNQRTSKMLINSIILSVFKYSCPILIDSNKNHINKLNTLLLKCTRPILGFSSYKLNTTTIMKKLKWNTIHHMLIIESCIFIHKCIFEALPVSINELITYSINRQPNIRSVRKPLIREKSPSIKCSQSLIYRAIYFYNQLPDIYRTYNTKKFKKYATDYITENFANNNIPKNEVV